MKKWVWHIGLTAAMGVLIAACTSSDGTNEVAGSSFETENSVALVLTVQNTDGKLAARTKVFVRPSDFVAGANSLSLSKGNDGESPVVESDSALGILNMETDDQGRLNLEKLKPGKYTIEAREDINRGIVSGIVVTDSSSDSVVIKISEPGSISGVVNNLPEDESSVKVGIEGLDYFVETDSAGKFEFKNIPAGLHNVVAYIYRTSKTVDLNGEPSTSVYDMRLGVSKINVSSAKESKNVQIGVKLIEIIKDPNLKDTTPAYPAVLFEDFEDSTYGWYTNFSKYAEAKLGVEENVLKRKGLSAHLEYSNDSNYNWVLMGHSMGGMKDFSDLDSVVFWARAGLGDSAQWISLSFDVQLDSAELEETGYENGKAWVHLTLDTTWQRFVVTPDDLLETDSTKNGGNIGWDAVKDHVTQLNFFGGGVGHSFELWLDDVWIYGVKDLE